MPERPAEWDIRPAQVSDLPALLILERRCYPNPWSEAQFRAELANPHARIDLCRVTGHLAGYHCWWYLFGELHVLNLATAAEWRRRGVAAALLQAALADTRGQGLERAFLEVRAVNAGAIALYHRFGFRITGRRRRYYPDGEDALLLEWTAPSAEEAG
jgi:ribosomal-protein-alanine N-acetyltransferase